jgi:hypothetical protein
MTLPFGLTADLGVLDEDDEKVGTSWLALDDVAIAASSSLLRKVTRLSPTT